MVPKNQLQLTLSRGRVGGASLQALDHHQNSLGDGQCCLLTHLVRRCLLRLCGDDWLSRGGLRLSVCGGLRQWLRAAGWQLTGLWYVSGAGDVLLWGADGEWRSVVLQHPLHESGEILFGTVRWQVCLTTLTEAGYVEDTERVVREVGKARQIEKVPGMVLQRTVHLLQAQELDGGQIHSGKQKK